MKDADGDAMKDAEVGTEMLQSFFNSELTPTLHDLMSAHYSLIWDCTSITRMKTGLYLAYSYCISGHLCSFTSFLPVLLSSIAGEAATRK